MLLLLNCKQTHQLVSQGLDRRLSLAERTKVKLHLSICKSCTNFHAQMALLRKVMHDYPKANTSAIDEAGK